MQATSLLSSGETLIIERHGRPIGYYIPIEAKDREAGRAAADRLDEFMKGILEKTGLTEDEFVEEIMREPFERRP